MRTQKFLKFNEKLECIEYEIIEKNHDMPKELQQIINYWKDYNKPINKVNYYTSSLKNTKIIFSYKNRDYCLVPKSIGISIKKYGFLYELIFDEYQLKIIEDLKKLKISNIIYMSQID